MDKLIQMITLAKRAQKLILGFDVVKASLQKGEAVLLLSASDISEKTNKEVRFLSEQFECPRISIPYTLDALWYSLGKRVGVISVIDEGFAKKITELSDLMDQEKQSILFTFSV